MEDSSRSRIGGLGTLSTIDVSTGSGCDCRADAIEDLIQTSINAISKLWFSPGRIQTQNDFVSNVGQSLKSGHRRAG